MTRKGGTTVMVGVVPVGTNVELPGADIVLRGSIQGCMSPTGGPPPGRSSTSAVLDLATNRMTVFGGFAFSTFNDTWVLDHANGLGGTPNWTELSPTGTLPTARTEHTAV